MIEFRILGPLELLAEQTELPVSGSKERALLSMLLLRAGAEISAERLIADLWDDQPPPSVRNSLAVRVAALRKVVGARLVTRGHSYLLRMEPTDAFDLARFERLAEHGGREELAQALALWRGPALAEFADQPWAWAPIARLAELRAGVLERRIDADLMEGLDTSLVAELREAVADHPLREHLRGQLMLALYRAGQQGEALEAYRDARSTLVERLGIEPNPALQELERAILRQDPALAHDRSVGPSHRIVIADLDRADPDSMLELATRIAQQPPRELILCRPIARTADLGAAAARLEAVRLALSRRGLTVRAAAFRSANPGADAARLATEQDAELVLVAASAEVLADPDIAALLAAAPCSVGLVIDGARRLGSGDGPVVVPFAGADHDWAAVELAVWLARSVEAPLHLVGPDEGDRDASRLLASASLAVQRGYAISTTPRLVAPDPDALTDAIAGACAVVTGLSERWAQEGLGRSRAALVKTPPAPVVLVRGGLRPGGLAPAHTQTRFTWSVRGGG